MGTIASRKNIQTYDVSEHADAFDHSNMQVIEWVPAWLSRAERLMIYSMTFCTRPLRYLEIGTFQGGSALLVSAALDALDSPGKMFCVDPEPRILPANWDKISHRATLFTGFSPDILPDAYTAAEGHFDLVFIDGDHSYDGVVRDAEGVLPYVQEGSILLFHDCFFSDVARGLDDFVQKHAERVVDFGPITREFTLQREEGRPDTSWGGLRMMQIR